MVFKRGFEMGDLLCQAVESVTQGDSQDYRTPAKNSHGSFIYTDTLNSGTRTGGVGNYEGVESVIVHLSVLLCLPARKKGRGADNRNDTTRQRDLCKNQVFGFLLSEPT